MLEFYTLEKRLVKKKHPDISWGHAPPERAWRTSIWTHNRYGREEKGRGIKFCHFLPLRLGAMWLYFLSCGYVLFLLLIFSDKENRELHAVCCIFTSHVPLPTCFCTCSWVFFLSTRLKIIINNSTILFLKLGWTFLSYLIQWASFVYKNVCMHHI